MKALFAILAFSFGAVLALPPIAAAPLAPARPVQSGTQLPAVQTGQVSIFDTAAITSIRGRIVKVQVPPGYDRVTIERRTAIRSRPWVPLATKPSDGTGQEITFVLRAPLPKRVLRVTAHRMPEVAQVVSSGISNFLGQETNPAGTTRVDVNEGISLGFGGVVTTDAGVMTLSANSTAGDLAVAAGSPSNLVASRDVVESDIWKLSGDRLYVFNPYRGLQVIDVTAPAAPKLGGTVLMPGAGDQLYTVGANHVALLSNKDCNFRWNNVPVTTQQGSVVVCDATSGAPKVVASLPIEGTISESRMVGSSLYIATQVPGVNDDYYRYDVLVTGYDLRNPASPVKRNSVRISASRENSYNYIGAVQASDHFFMVSQNVYQWDPVTFRSDFHTEVALVDISALDGSVRARGKAKVAGSVHDKFKMQERNNVLTAISDYWSPAFSQRCTHLENFSLTNPDLPKSVGVLELGRNESVRGTRFDGDRIYVVTFLQIDPLWIVDNANVANPQIVSHLEVPGFSTYLHPLGDRLVTIGLVNNRVAVSLFDVADPKHPKTLSQLPLSESWVGSEAVWNEKAFTVLPEQGLIMLPVNAGWNQHGVVDGGVQLVDLGRDGLTLRGRIQHNFTPRRATVHRDTVLALGNATLLSADIKDRDHPIVVSDLDLAWRVDFVWHLGRYLLQIGGGVESSANVISVSPDAKPDDTVSSLAIGDEYVLGADCRDGYLYVVQRGPGTWVTPIVGPSFRQLAPLKVSVYSVASLPVLKKVGEVSIDNVPELASYRLQLLWPVPGTLVVAAQSGYGYFTIQPFVINNGMQVFAADASAGQVVAATDFAATGVNANALRADFAPIYFFPQKITQHLVSVDLTDPAAPKALDILTIEPKTRVNFSNVHSADGKLFLTHHHQWYYYPYRTPILLNADTPTLDQFAAVGEVNLDELEHRKLRGRYFLDVVDYSDPTNPVVREPVSAPGFLHGVARDGKLLYTSGPEYNELGAPNYAAHNLQASTYDGSKLILAATYPVSSLSNQILPLGDLVFTFDHQRSGQNPNLLEGTARLLEFNEEAGFKLLDLAPFDAYGIRAFGDVLLGTASSNNGYGLGALDFSNPTDLRNLGTYHLGWWLYPTTDRAVGNRTEGFWFPLGVYGLLHVDLPAQQ